MAYWEGGGKVLVPPAMSGSQDVLPALLQHSSPTIIVDIMFAMY